MTGLQNIIFHIEADASAQSEKIKEDAERFAERQIEDAVLEAEKIAEKDKLNAKKAAEDLVKRAEAECRMKYSHSVLLKKQSIIEEAIGKTRIYIKEMDLDEYFEFLDRLLKKYALNGTGTIFMSKKDIKRMPKFFKKELKNLALAPAEGETCDSGGFVLEYGNVLINCTTKALLDDNREKISDMLSHTFFDRERGS